MASDKKANKAIKADKRSRRIMGVVFAAIIIAVIGFFISISGVLSKFIPGVKITQTVDGKTETVESVSIIECSYYFQQIKQQYKLYGLLNDEVTLDTVYDEESGKTYYEALMDTAATKLQNLVIEYHYAKDQGFDDHGISDRIAEMSMDEIAEMATTYHYSSAEQFLQAQYGNGMSSRIYKNIVAREAYVQAYEASLSQAPVSDADIAAEISSNPDKYNNVSFNVYYFAVDVDQDYTAEDAFADAQAVTGVATDSDSFKEAVLSKITEEQAELVGITEDANPTYHEAQNISQWVYYLPEDVLDFLFTTGVPGDTNVIPAIVTGEGDEETVSGYYALLIDDKSVNEEETVSYRVLTLPCTPETVDQVVAQANDIMNGAADEEAFINAIVANSESESEVGTLGYVSGRTRSAFESVVTNEDGTTSTTVNDAELVDWLFDANTVTGSKKVYASADGTSVKVIYFLDRCAVFENDAKTAILSANSETITTIVTTTNEPSYVISYKLIKMFGYVD